MHFPSRRIALALVFAGTLLALLALLASPARAARRSFSNHATARHSASAHDPFAVRAREPGTRAHARRDDARVGSPGNQRDSIAHAQRKLLRQLLAAQSAHRQAEARAQRRYALSQIDAPILADTRACKRIGAHGEAIYENCALTMGGKQVR